MTTAQPPMHQPDLLQPNAVQPDRPLRIFISTGEVSGDLQGALLIEALQRQAQQLNVTLEISALGGDRMAAAGATLIGDTSGIGSMGLFESVPFVIPTLKVQRRAKAALKRQPPDVVVLIDYMGPNIAWCNYLAREMPDIPVVYYIAPQEWVWALNNFNTRNVVRASRRILAIFPEEARYFEKHGGQVQWVGHPLVDRMATAIPRNAARQALGIDPDRPVVVLVPASRRQEIRYLLPVICQAAQIIQSQVPDVQFLIPLALETYRQPIEQAIAHYGLNARILADQTPQTGDDPAQSTTLQAIAAADLAITKSGTVNLELALLNTPQVILYKVNRLTAWVLQYLLNFSIPFMSPPNLVLMREIVPEFMQHFASPENLAREALDILHNPDRRQQILTDYQAMREALGTPGVCDRAAAEILHLVPLITPPGKGNT